MNGPIGTRSSGRSTRDWPSKLSVLTQLAKNLTTVDLRTLVAASLAELDQRASLLPGRQSTGD